jgi:hypothetical protein
MGDSISVAFADRTSFASWAYRDLFDTAPGTSEFAEQQGAKDDELHAVVIDKNGRFTGTVGAVLETYPFLSKAKNGKDANFAPSFYKSVLNQKSAYIRVLDGEEGGMSEMIPVMLMSQLGLGGTDPAAGGAMMSQMMNLMMMQKIMGAKDGSSALGKGKSPFFTPR